MTLSDLQKLMNDFSACESLAPIKDHFSAPLSRILLALSSSAASEDGFNNYLKFKQIEKDIAEIQQFVNSKSNQQHIQSLAVAKEFQALETTKVFLITQQQEWYPHYLVKEIQSLLDREDSINAGEKLGNTIQQIVNNNSMTGKEKTEHITTAITAFAKSKNLTLFADKAKPLKVNLKDILEAQRELNIHRLYPGAPDASQEKENTPLKKFGSKQGG